MTIDEVNPDSVVLRQLDGQWQKFAAMIVWKLARDGVTLTLEDIEQFNRESNAGKAVLFTHGHKESIEFKIVDAESAKVLAEHDANQRGRA